MKQGFQYHAFATGFAGRITHPLEHVIESLAPSALSPAGGYSSNRVERYRFKEIVSFQSAYTQVAGAYVEKDGEASWDTVTTSIVEGLDIMGVVKADRIVARLASRHSAKGGQPSILPLSSHIDGLEIAGFKVKVTWNVDRYCHLDTHEKVVKAYGSNEEKFRDDFDAENFVGRRAEIADRHWHFFPVSHDEPGKAIAADRTITTSIVKTLEVGSDYLKPRGHVIHVPQFGTVLIGQLSIEGDARQITMLQVEPACAVGIGCTAGSGQTNGKPVPPIPPST